MQFNFSSSLEEISTETRRFFSGSIMTVSFESLLRRLERFIPGGMIGWSAEANIAKSYFHQCHIVCTVPRYPNLYRGGTVSITVKCGQKSSHPANFVYTPCGQFSQISLPLITSLFKLFSYSKLYDTLSEYPTKHYIYI